MANGAPKKILIVEDDLVSSMAISLMLQDEGYEVVDQLMSADNLLESVESTSPDLLLLDVRLKGHIDGTTAAQQLRKTHELPIIFLTAFNDEETKLIIQKISNSGLINKPYNLNEIVTTIEKVFSKS